MYFDLARRFHRERARAATDSGAVVLAPSGDTQSDALAADLAHGRNSIAARHAFECRIVVQKHGDRLDPDLIDTRSTGSRTAPSTRSARPAEAPSHA